MHEPLEHMKAWVMAGADVNQGDYDGRTPLHLVSIYTSLIMSPGGEGVGYGGG